MTENFFNYLFFNTKTNKGEKSPKIDKHKEKSK